MRVAFVLRSAEVQPLFRDLCRCRVEQSQVICLRHLPILPPLSCHRCL